MLAHFAQRVDPLCLGRRPWVVRGGQTLGGRIQDDEAGGALRVGRREERRDPRSLLAAPQDGLLGARSVHDRTDVVHPRLERGNAGDPVGETRPPLVEHEQPPVLGEAEDVPDEQWVLPRREHVSREPSDEHQVDRSLADHLVRDRDPAAPGVVNLGDVHLSSPSLA